MVGTEVIYLDTHVLIYIGAGEVNRLGVAARKAIDRDDLLVSAASVLELELLHEIGRLKPTASKLVSTLATDIGLRVCDLPFRTIVDQAIAEDWTRDPFDRLIVANAKAAGAVLVTRDERIRGHYSRALW
ncbi:MAG: type II toxin-antitoxin system VapC family toxin [Bryobacteraceae bacterium]|jgi:PIN domain nuclease of toxin-antitoxin system